MNKYLAVRTELTGKTIHPDKRGFLALLLEALWTGDFGRRPPGLSLTLAVYFLPICEGKKTDININDRLVNQFGNIWAVAGVEKVEDKEYPATGLLKVNVFNINIFRTGYNSHPGAEWRIAYKGDTK